MNEFNCVKDDNYTLYELKSDDNIYIEEINEHWNSKKVYLVHNHRTNQTFPLGKFYKSLKVAMNKALQIYVKENK
tara:strand:+ start:2270 stop:2494 length:225 start_codon:yes stop_codon:yes gene_type:complete